MRTLLFTLFGYFSGSVLYASLFCRLFGKSDALRDSSDGNPGTANAFICGGFSCGTLTLLCELLKAIVPVWLYVGHDMDVLSSPGIVPVLAAPVIGHVFSAFHRLRGGKGIAATFGCLLGLLPYARPLLLFAAMFVFFSVVVVIRPNFARTIVTFLCTAVGMIVVTRMLTLTVGFLLITAAVLYRMHSSDEERERMRVGLLWTH